MKILIQLLLFVTMTIASTTIELNTADTNRVVELVNQQITKDFINDDTSLLKAEEKEEEINEAYIRQEERFYEKNDQIDIDMDEIKVKLEELDLLKAEQELETAKNKKSINVNNIKLYEEKLKEIVKPNLLLKLKLSNLYVQGLFISYTEVNYDKEYVSELTKSIKKKAIEKLNGKEIVVVDKKNNDKLISKYFSKMSAKVRTDTTNLDFSFNTTGRKKLYIKVLAPKIYPYKKDETQSYMTDTIDSKNTFFIRTKKDLDKFIAKIDAKYKINLSKEEHKKIEDILKTLPKIKTKNANFQDKIEEILKKELIKKQKIQRNKKETKKKLDDAKKQIPKLEEQVKQKQKNLNNLKNKKIELEKNLSNLKNKKMKQDIILTKAFILKDVDSKNRIESLKRIIKEKLPIELDAIETGDEEYVENGVTSTRTYTKKLKRYKSIELTYLYSLKEIGILVKIVVKQDTSKYTVEKKEWYENVIDWFIEKYIDIKNYFYSYIEPELVLIKSGSFQMGSNENSDEKPIHRVTIDYDFSISKYPITKEEFRKFIEDTYYKTEAEKYGKSMVLDEETIDWEYKEGYYWDNAGFEQTEQHPVVHISFDDAKEYVKWLSEKTGKTYRLPTEAEWEYAARAGTTTKWSFGNDKSQITEYAKLANSSSSEGIKKYYRKNDLELIDNDGDFEYTAPVGSYKPNPWGIYDMHGNVWEWCEDWYIDSYKTTPTDGKANKKGDKKYKVLRGGSWFNTSYFLRSFGRSRSYPTNTYYSVGFRLVSQP